ncbi:ubiquitin-associated domain-containing protein 2 isoform 2-T2 [Molossus nigricans]
MFSSTGSSGLYKAPLSKSLLLVPSALSLLLILLLPHCQRFFLYDLQAVKDNFQIWRLICGRIICLDLKDTFCSSLLIYNFRIFERRYGSRKFASFLLGSWVLSALVDFILVEAVWYSFGITTSRNLPSGFLAPVFALFVPFYCSIPRVQVAHILGPLSVTNKTLIYILGLQLFTSGSYIWIVAISGLISGICYNSKILQVHQVLYIPSWMAEFFSRTLEPIFSSSEPTTEARVGMGATVDIQRQQRMELLDRQLMLSQFAQVRRQRQQQMLHFLQIEGKTLHRQTDNDSFYCDTQFIRCSGTEPAISASLPPLNMLRIYLKEEKREEKEREEEYFKELLKEDPGFWLPVVNSPAFHAFFSVTPGKSLNSSVSRGGTADGTESDGHSGAEVRNISTFRSQIAQIMLAGLITFFSLCGPTTFYRFHPIEE